MAWLKLDDQIFAHPKIINLSKDAKLLHLAAPTYCAGQLTDGRLSPGAVRMAAAQLDQVDVDASTCVDELLESCLWELAPGGRDYCIHDFLDYNPSGEQVRAEQVWAVARAHLRPIVFARDGYACQYCGATGDLTVDHIIPQSRGGENSLANLRTTCRSCNSAKGARTPEEWAR